MKISIIICTRDRVDDLRGTLDSLAGVCLAEGLEAELLVVDNGSSDGTRAFVEMAALPQMPVRYLYEPRKGQCYARNMGLEAASGEIVLFTDDDIRFPPDWLIGMAAPFQTGRAEVVAGGVRIAEPLRRPWMEYLHLNMLASTESYTPETMPGMVGANMAFSREVLQKVPRFDLELGPGALGFADETLFFMQLREAGYRFYPAIDVVVEHHLHPTRLLYRWFVERVAGGARSSAYVDYHWEHRKIAFPRLRQAWQSLKLARIRKREQSWKREEGISLQEIYPLTYFHYYQQFQIESRRPRNYERHGLQKLHGLR